VREKLANGVNFSSTTSGDLETKALAAQIPHLNTSCGKGTAKSSPKSLMKKIDNG